MSDELFLEDGDPLLTELTAGAPPRPAKGYITVNMAWLGRVLPLVRGAEQLVVLLLIYRRCVLARSRTASLPNGDAGAVGMSRQGKYRALAALKGGGLITQEPRNGKAVRVMLLDFP
jgi:hypothetical protein